jgi:hypothetical protein
MGKKTEYVDSSLTEVFSSNSPSVKLLSYGSCMVEIFMLLFMVGIPVIGILAKGPLSLSHFLSKLVILVILYVPFTIFWLLFTLKRFVSEINRSFRDPKVIERARELIERGYNVLIVRGSEHKDFIIRGLQKYSIDCKSYPFHNDIGCIHILDPFLDLFCELLYGIAVALAHISRPLNKEALQTKRRHRTSKAPSPLAGDDAIRT